MPKIICPGCGAIYHGWALKYKTCNICQKCGYLLKWKEE